MKSINKLNLNYNLKIKLFSFISLIISLNFKDNCFASSIKSESKDDYIIDFFRKTGKYPSTGYFESSGVYGTPLVLRSHDSSLWTILLAICFCTFILGIGILLLANYISCTEHDNKDNDELYDSDDEIKHLNYLQRKFVREISYPNMNYYQFDNYGSYQYNTNPQYIQV